MGELSLILCTDGIFSLSQYRNLYIDTCMTSTSVMNVLQIVDTDTEYLTAKSWKLQYVTFTYLPYYLFNSTSLII